jgi:hypothetical protein
MAVAMFKFPPEKLGALSEVYDSGGFQVVLDIMEQFCDEAENDFLGTKPSEPAQVLAAHAIMHAQRVYFQKVAEKIDYLVAEHRSTDKKDTASKRTTAIK